MGWAQKHTCTNTLLDAVLTHLLWCPEKLEKQESCKKFASQGYPWLLLLVSVSTWTVQELAWTTPTPLQSNSMPIHFASIFHLLLRVVRTSPVREGGKGQIFPSFGLGTFPREQLTLHSANTFMALRHFP